MMQTLAILCEQGIDQNEIAKIVGTSSAFTVKIFTNAPQLVGAINEGLIAGLIFGIRHFSPGKTKFLDLIKNKLPIFPIVLTSQKLDKSIRTLADDYSYFTVVKYPEELNNLTGVFSKILKNERVIARKTVRYDVQLPAKLSCDGREFKCRLSNLSRGGAQVEVKNAHFESGQNMVLFVPLFDDLKHHNLSARVVWAKKIDQKSILGLEFSFPEIPVF